MSTEHLASQKMADPEGFEPSVCKPATIDSKGNSEPLNSQSSLISSLNAGFDSPELGQVVNEWQFLNDALKQAILAIVESSKAGRGSLEI